MYKFLRATRRTLAAVSRDQSGISAIEYGVLLTLIAVGAVQALGALGGEVSNSLDNTAALVASNDMGGGSPNPDPDSPDEPPVAGSQPDPESEGPIDEPPIGAMGLP